MRNNCLVKLYLCLFVLLISFNFFSCSSGKNIKYFQDISDSTKVTNLAAAAYVEPKIQVDDIINIFVQTVDPQATMPIILGNIATTGNGTSLVAGGSSIAAAPQVVSGYLVDKNGNVDVPVLGKLALQGMTTSEAKQLILKRSLDFYKDPTVNVRFANFRVSVTGEVLRPSTYIIPNEKVSILDALAMAGDLTIFGKRDNVLLIRESIDGTKTAYRINLNSSKILSSPLFYLHQNDFIYVEPTKGKAAANDLAQTRNITIATSVLSVIIVLLTRIK